MLLLPNLLPLPGDVKEDGKGERLEVVEETEPSTFQLQANQRRDVNIVTKSTVGVPEGLILTVHKSSVGSTTLSSLIVSPIRTRGDNFGGGTTSDPRLNCLWEVRVQVALVENWRYSLNGLQLNAPLARGSLPRVEC